MSATSSAPSSTQSYHSNANANAAMRPTSHMSTTMAAPNLPPMPSVHANSTPAPALAPSLSPTDLAPATAAPGLPEYFSALRQFGSGNLGPRVAVHAFVPTRADELQVRAGDTVFVEHAFADGWARGRMHGYVGLFPLGIVAPAGPGDFVVVALHNDMARMAAAQPDQVVPLTPGGHVWAGPTPRTASFKRLSRV
ncbi:hypothetical protein BCR44DRAFT_36383 [Catenaria anguillulae PL171]|uniref:SH3 domain-containing protein n=1 Tax=Catenaria anguillulae PL171 TaxID=765915 RepID=A0A1Y2HQH5_9FUNG|nr:hypothetical protein BCR44DRAFT_36383 [Catenaria anguillulae PL171]